MLSVKLTFYVFAHLEVIWMQIDMDILFIKQNILTEYIKL